METDRHDVEERVAESKARMSDKLSELANRVDAARDAVQPAALVKRTWVRFSIALVAGYIVGSRFPRIGPVLLAPLLKEVVLAAGSTTARRMVQQYLAPRY